MSLRADFQAQIRLDKEELERKTIDQLKAENDLYKNAHKTEQDRRRAYEQALTDIKEIATDESYVGFWDEQISQILKKCEVLDE